MPRVTAMPPLLSRLLPPRPGGRMIRGGPLQESLDLLARSRTPLSRTERKVVVDSLFHEGARRSPFLHRYYSLTMLSVLIAVLGLLADSTAVVIGAMLVAPLMGPVLGVSAALVMDWPRRVAGSAATVATGSFFAVALATVISFAMPGDPPMLSDELLARTSPTLLDLAVALVAGSAGAYAKVRRQAADAIVGVAVAVALVPPLAVIGITLELGRYQMALGSFLLFLANVSGIVTAGALTFIVLGFVPGGRLHSTRSHVARSLRLATLGSVLIVAPLQVMDQWRPEPTIDSNPQELVAAAVEAWRGDVSIIAMDLTLGDGDATAPLIELTVTSDLDPQRPLAVDTLAEELALIIGEPVEVSLTTVESNVQTAIGEGDPAHSGQADTRGE
ncbi:MAG: DUF389 domain-containing protein [Acidimicrobiales bacterium]|nr:DUF389 domain-containing protein [Acidimicrobiales bacterium]